MGGSEYEEIFGGCVSPYGRKAYECFSARHKGNLRDSMNNYAKALKACAQEYQKAQEDIYNLASMLPRW